ncbi:MAG: efflux RND transporter periplasmic adaptor subunit [Bacteroidales bacterium]|nr:efflux RND transporter periplasmic adaptor subunit [Bacteroidales bacterium]
MKKILYGILFVILFFTACKQKTMVEDTSVQEPATIDTITFTKAQIDMAGITTGTFSGKEMSNVIHCNGIIEVPLSGTVTISTVTGGIIKHIRELYPGSYVKKGEVLASIENPEFINMQRDYLESKGQYEYLSVEYKRQQELSKENAASQKSLQQVKSEYEMVNARLMAAKAQLSMLGINKDDIEKNGMQSTVSIIAPMNGYISGIAANAGKYIVAGEPIFNITDKSQMRLALNLYERDLAYVDIGNEVLFKTVASSTEENKAKVTYISEVIDREKRSIELTAMIIPVMDYFRPGMYVTAQVHSGSRQVMALPETAIAQYDNGNSIFISKGNLFERKDVELGITQDGFVEIVNAAEFSENDIIVTKGAYYIDTELLKRLE